MPTTMDYQKTMQALKRLRVETGSLACFGCGHEHNCSTQGCAILRNAVGHMEAALANYDHLSALTKQQAEDIQALEHATLTPPNEWVSVEERLPEDEARQYIEDDLDGIGYLYPCLLTYKSPNTERIHVVRFYYDIIQKWFVDNGEELCEKGRCIAWMPLPAPYDRRPTEVEK